MTRIIAQFIILVTLIGTSFGLVAPVTAQVCYTYRTIDIPTPSGLQGFTSLEAISPVGLIVGQYANQEPPDGYTLKRQRSLLVVKNYRPLRGGPTWPRGINRFGDTVGMQRTAPGVFTGYFRRANGVVQTVAVPGAFHTHALDTNSLRDVVGSFSVLDPATGFLGHANGFWRYKGQYLTINAPDGVFGTELTGINLHQDIVGWYMDALGVIHGLHIVDGVQAVINVPGAENTFVLDLNDAGAMVGMHAPSDAFGQGFLYQDGVFYPISPGVGEMHSEATGINNVGEIVGNYLSADGLTHGFVATPTRGCTTPALAMAE